MNVFNRAVAILQIVLLIILLIVAAVVPNTVLGQIGYIVEQAQTALQVGWPRSYIIFLVAAIPLIFLLIVLLWLEIRPGTSNKVVVRGRDGTRTEVSTSSVAQSLRLHVDEIEDVFNVKSAVRGKRGGMEIRLSLETTPEIDIPAKMEEVSKAARDLIEGKMGLRIADIKVNVSQASYTSAKPAQPAPVTAPPSEPGEVVSAEEPATDVTAPEGERYEGF
jgi:hypothetical protein